MRDLSYLRRTFLGQSYKMPWISSAVNPEFGPKGEFHLPTLIQGEVTLVSVLEADFEDTA